ncbi:hypothetical protein C8Q79DRAFT_924088 [Trametes meyenii]|nr:hypothetical protein C8Q79DRAFT_924088 [Trametes meyenii]
MSGINQTYVVKWNKAFRVPESSGRIVIGCLGSGKYGLIVAGTDAPQDPSGNHRSILNAYIDGQMQFSCAEEHNSVTLDCRDVVVTFRFSDVLRFFDLVRVLTDVKTHLAVLDAAYSSKMQTLYQLHCTPPRPDDTPLIGISEADASVNARQTVDASVYTEPPPAHGASPVTGGVSDQTTPDDSGTPPATKDDEETDTAGLQAAHLPGSFPIDIGVSDTGFFDLGEVPNAA